MSKSGTAYGVTDTIKWATLPWAVPMGRDVDCPLCGRIAARAATATLDDLSAHFVNECPAIKTESNRRRF